jgi:hypothetical protein
MDARFPVWGERAERHHRFVVIVVQNAVLLQIRIDRRELISNPPRELGGDIRRKLSNRRRRSTLIRLPNAQHDRVN